MEDVVVGDDNNFGFVDNTPLPLAVNADDNGAADRASSATTERRRPLSNTLIILLFVVLAFSVSTNDLDNAINSNETDEKVEGEEGVAVWWLLLLLGIFGLVTYAWLESLVNGLAYLGSFSLVCGKWKVTKM